MSRGTVGIVLCSLVLCSLVLADGASSDNLTECWAELSDIEKKYCGMALSEVARSQMEEAIGEKI